MFVRQAEKKEKPALSPIAQASRDSQDSQGSDEEPPESFDNNFLAYQENKMKAVFSKLDWDGKYRLTFIYTRKANAKANFLM